MSSELDKVRWFGPGYIIRKVKIVGVWYPVLYLTPEDFAALPHHDTTIPAHRDIGTRWRANGNMDDHAQSPQWWVVEIGGTRSDPKYVISYPVIIPPRQQSRPSGLLLGLSAARPG